MPVKKAAAGNRAAKGKLSSFKEAEVSQLEDFLRTRNATVEAEIEKLRGRLSVHNVSLPPEINSFQEKSSLLSAPASAPISDLAVAQTSKRPDSVVTDEFHSTGMYATFPSTEKKIDMTQTAQSIPSDVKVLLKRIHTHARDQGKSDSELIDWLLPPGLVHPDQTAIPLSEVVNIFQIDLAMPINEDEQEVLYNMYCVRHGSPDVDVKRLLEDAHMWNPVKHSSMDKHSSFAKRANDIADIDLALDALKSPQLSPQRPTSPRIQSRTDLDSLLDTSLVLSPSPVGVQITPEAFSPSDKQPEKLEGILKNTVLQADELVDLQHQIQRSISPDLKPSRERANEYSKTRDIATVHFDQQRQAPVVVSNGDDILSTLRSSHERSKQDALEANRIAVLSAENDRLKRELSTFDSSFFDQLEDLKFRYSTLQEIVGEQAGSGPMPLDNVRTPSEYAPHDIRGSSRGGTLHAFAGRRGPPGAEPSEYVHPPLDKLAWGTKQSLSALDRAGVTQPIANERPKHVSAFSYAPGGVGTAKTSTSLSLDRGNAFVDPVGSFARKSHGGTHGLGGGTFSSTGDGTLSDLCERRLVFELSNHTSPSQATRTLIHRVSDIGASKGQGFISCQQLFDVCKSIGLRLSQPEIDSLAIGFASDGKGNIDCRELCHAVQALMYNVLGSHSIPSSTGSSLQPSKSGSTVSSEGERNGVSSQGYPVKALLDEICQSILIHDRKAVLGSSDGKRQSSASLRKRRLALLVRPFLEIDHTNTGIMTSPNFCKALRSLGIMLTMFEMNSVGAAYSSGNIVSTPKLSLSSSFENEPSPFQSVVVSYKPFLKDITVLLEQHTKHEADKLDDKIKTDSSWVLKEFDIVDAMITQMEAMKPADRRRALMSLQYALQAADATRQEEVDGFTVLKALLSSGFKLQRLDRVRLLRAAEELGGKMKYSEFFNVLLKSCAEWPSEEVAIVGKILTSMGVTVLERRAWLARVRQDLLSADSKTNGKVRIGSVKDPSIPPAVFLHVLRENGVTLSIEEEATLLDCLVTERQAELIGKSYSGQRTTGDSVMPEPWVVPQIYYKSFLSFCTRHCGHWSDAVPELNGKIKTAIRGIADKAQAVHELNSLLLAFDEEQTGYVGKRAFQVACHRSRLLANLKEEALEKLSDVLSAEGAGHVSYVPFIIHMKVLCSKCVGYEDDVVPDIAEQLIKNSTDAMKTLGPLRRWLVNHTDCESYTLTPRDMNALLREFSVVYRPEDLEAFTTDLNHKPGDVKGSSASSVAKRVIDTRDLIRHLLTVRGSWSQYQNELCLKIRRLLALIGDDRVASRDEDEENGEVVKFSSRHSESTNARRLITRLRALSAVNQRVTNSDDSLPHGFIDKLSFGMICRGAGLNLSDQDIALLADATDANPYAENIRYNVILEALAVEARRHSDSNLFALNHLCQLLWNTASKLHRTKEEWIADVSTVFKGFDASGTGFISTEDFSLALSLLTVPLSHNIMKELPMYPDGDGLVPYRQLLSSVLEPPEHSKFNRAGSVKPSGGEHYYDYMDAKYEFQPGDTAGMKAKSTDNFHKRLTGKLPSDRPELFDEDTHPLRGIAASALNTISDKRQANRPNAGKDLGYGSAVANISEGENEDTQYNQKKNHMKAVSALTKVIRKVLKDVLMENNGIEIARRHMLKAFRRFDSEETEKCLPRDFCLAVSVLLGDDAIVLNKNDWTDIVEHFMDEQGKLVEYENFCSHVLRTSDIENVVPSEASKPLGGPSRPGSSKPSGRKMTGTTRAEEPSSSTRFGDSAARKTVGARAGSAVGSSSRYSARGDSRLSVVGRQQTATIGGRR